MENKAITKNWYIVNTYSSHEQKVKDNLEKRIESHNLQDYIFRIVVAEEEIPVLKNGVPTGKTKSRNIFPGYIFIEMIMTDEAWYMVRNTPGVTGFIGSSGGGTKPFPVARAQMESVLKRIGVADEEMFCAYKVGDQIKIVSGPFLGVEGEVTDIDKEAGEVECQVFMLGRLNSQRFKFSEIEKM